MKTLILLALVCVCGAADYVELTLKDGRVLVGEYDAFGEVLDLGKGKITVRQDQVAKCSAAERPIAKPVESTFVAQSPPVVVNDTAKAWADLEAADDAYHAAVRRVLETTLAKAKATRAKLPAAIPLSDDMTIAVHKAAERQNAKGARLDQGILRIQSILNPENRDSLLNRNITGAFQCITECKAMLKALDD
jgi:hypothetical protein